MITLSTTHDSCRLCGGPADVWVRYDLANFQPKWRQQGVATTVDVARCRTHGSWFTRLVPDADVLGSQYQGGSMTDYYAAETRSPARRTGRLLQALRRAVPLGAQVVDVGGGDGSFAVLASQAGYRSAMVEIGDLDETPLNAAGVQRLHSLGPDQAEAFDAATLWDVYEHVWPHDTFLEPIRQALRPRGRLLIEVPSPSNLVWPLLLLGLASRSPRREVAWAQVVSYTHVQLMTPEELVATLPRHGFEVVSVDTRSDLAYQGVEYARRLVPWDRAAQAVGAVFDHPGARRWLLGCNKTTVVAEKV